MVKVKIVLNEQHSLLNDQVRVLDERFGKDTWDILPIPADGLTAEEQVEKAESFLNSEMEVLIFASPLPVMMKKAVEFNMAQNISGNNYPDVLVFHNDVREKKELPNGRIISVVAQEGWQLV